MKFFLFLLLAFFLFSPFVFSSSLGVSPPSTEYIFLGQETISGSFSINPYGEKNIITYPKQDLAEYFFIEGGNKTTEQKISSRTIIDYYLKLPKNVKPGEYNLIIINEQVPTPEEIIANGGAMGAYPAVAFLIKIRVPNEGKFLEGSLEITPSSIKSGDIVYFKINLLNFGTEQLSNIAPGIIIRDPNNIELERKSTKEITSLNPAESTSTMAYWDTKGQSSGVYTVESSIDYGGKSPLELKTQFRIGDINIKIVNVTTDLSEKIGKIYIDIESNWNEQITNVYADIKIKNNTHVIDSIKTSSINLAPWGKDRLTGFWERNSLSAGEYTLEIYVHYFDKQANKEITVSLSDAEDKKSPIFSLGNNTLILVVIILLALILLINLAKLFISFKNKKDKDK